MWFYVVVWGILGFLIVMFFVMNKVEGDNISGVCFVGFYDLDVFCYFVFLLLCFCVFVGFFFFLVGIIFLNYV